MKNNRLKILFLLENTADAPAGGTEISSRHLASMLKKKGVNVIEWAPYRIRRMPFWYTSLFFFPLLIFKTLIAAQKEKVNLIHVQGKYLVPVGVITAKILKIPVVVTIRDYFIFCPIGLCLFDEIKRHGFISFFFQEVPRFLKTYHREEILINRLIRITALLRAWYVSWWIRWWTNRANTVVAVSTYVQSVLRVYRVQSFVIHNCFNVLKYRKVLRRRRSTTSETNIILFVGKDSYGKGSDLFDAMSKKKEFSIYRFVKLTTDRWTPYEQVLRAMRDALVTVVPSRWQEPFGRVALESLMVGTPVVATNRGGLLEIVENGKTGILCEPSTASLRRGLKNVLIDQVKIRKTILQQKQIFTQRFSFDPVEQHLTLYERLLGKIGDG